MILIFVCRTETNFSLFSTVIEPFDTLHIHWGTRGWWCCFTEPGHNGSKPVPRHDNGVTVYLIQRDSRCYGVTTTRSCQGMASMESDSVCNSRQIELPGLSTWTPNDTGCRIRAKRGGLDERFESKVTMSALVQHHCGTINLLLAEDHGNILPDCPHWNIR